MNVPAERLLDELQISSAQLRDFEDKGIVQGMLKAGRIFYSPRDVYRIKGILLYMTRGLPLEEAKWRIDHPTRKSLAPENRE